MEEEDSGHRKTWNISLIRTILALEQVKREHPEYLNDGWSSPTSYASLLELKQTRGIKPAHAFAYAPGQADVIELKASMQTEKSSSGVISQIELEKLTDIIDRASQKKIAILINEGTASAAEVFASALHDNGRTVALIGNDSYGKGLIQHTFPLPDGGGLRLVVPKLIVELNEEAEKFLGNIEEVRENLLWVEEWSLSFTFGIRAMILVTISQDYDHEEAMSDVRVVFQRMLVLIYVLVLLLMSWETDYYHDGRGSHDISETIYVEAKGWKPDSNSSTFSTLQY
eukprot:scaffold248557_cov70-Cyclotella_meneghiniana.AAC.2